MFIYSVRASTLRFFGVLFLTICLTVVLVLFGSGQTVFASGTVSGSVDYSGIRTAEDRAAFLKNFGIEVREGSEEETTFTMPENFDRVMLGYNELQKAQGLDISKYKKKKVTRYTYEVLNYPDYEGGVYANLLVYRGKIIACDVCSANPEGFVIPLTEFGK